MNLNQITPVVLTWNEEANIGRTLRRLDWAARVVVIDSGSSDRTLQDCREFPNVEVFVRPFDNHTNQWNFGLDQVKTLWVFSLDADYLLTPELMDEIRRLPESADVAAYLVPLLFCVEGTPLRGSLLPPRLALFRRDAARYVQDGHTQTLSVQGPLLKLQSGIWHDERKPLARWLEAQSRYAALEVQKLRSTPWRELGWPDRIRQWIVVAPILVPLLAYLRGAILDGRRGLFYVFQRMLAEVILSLSLLERPPSTKS